MAFRPGLECLSPQFQWPQWELNANLYLLHRPTTPLGPRKVGRLEAGMTT